MRKKIAILMTLVLVPLYGCREFPAESTIAEKDKDIAEESASIGDSTTGDNEEPLYVEDVKYDEAAFASPMSQFIDVDFTFVLNDGTEIVKTLSVSDLFGDIRYYDITGDGIMETVFETKFSNTAGEHDLVNIYKYKDGDIVELYPVDYIPEIESPLPDTKVISCGIKGLPPHLLDVKTLTKDGPQSFYTSHEVIVWKDGEFELFDDYEIPAWERFDENTIQYHKELFGHAINRSIMDGVAYNREDPVSVWTCTRNAIISLRMAIYPRPGIEVTNNDGILTVSATSDIVRIYAGALFSGLETLPDVPEGIGVSYDSAVDTYTFEGSFFYTPPKAEDRNSFFVTDVTTMEGDEEITNTIMIRENPDEKGSHIFPYAVHDVQPIG